MLFEKLLQLPTAFNVANSTVLPGAHVDCHIAIASMNNLKMEYDISSEIDIDNQA